METATLNRWQLSSKCLYILGMRRLNGVAPSVAFHCSLLYSIVDAPPLGVATAVQARTVLEYLLLVAIDRSRMVNRCSAALQGVDPDRRRRERKNNIVNARANAREERLNHRRRLDADPNQEAQLATNVSSSGPARGLEELQTNVWSRNL